MVLKGLRDLKSLRGLKGVRDPKVYMSKRYVPKKVLNRHSQGPIISN